MKHSAGSCQHRGSEHFSDRNIHICHAVFKIGLCFRVFQSMKMDQKVRLIFSFTLDFHPLTGIQRINDGLLDFLVFLIIQSVDLYDLAEDFREVLTDLRYRIGDDRKASLL